MAQRRSAMVRRRGGLLRKLGAMCGSELHSLPEGVQRVARHLEASGHPHAPVMLDDAARTAQQAADALVGKTGRADAEFVKTRTGFSIGGVSPVAHATAPVVLIDRELSRFDEIWAAAGHPHAVFKLRPADLEALTGGAPVADVVQAPAA